VSRATKKPGSFVNNDLQIVKQMIKE